MRKGRQQLFGWSRAKGIDKMGDKKATNQKAPVVTGWYSTLKTGFCQLTQKFYFVSNTTVKDT
jgi:hypothetical protein